MIRREITDDDGAPAWLLISQIDHARVAGELARDWGNPPLRPLPWADVMLPTIFHHDDGWAAWEQQPTIDPTTGRPRAFTEMSIGLAHEIWRRSIDAAARWGPLAQYMVAQHFMRLRRGGDETDQPGVQAFLAHYDERCASWLRLWHEEDPSAHTPEAAERAVDFLQMFDAASLLLCCTPRESPYELHAPHGLRLTMHRTPPMRRMRQGVVINPWPWTTGEKTISAAGRTISAAPLAGDEQLRKRLAAAEMVELTWKFVTDPGDIVQ